MQINIEKVQDEVTIGNKVFTVEIPKYETEGAAGFDLRGYVPIMLFSDQKQIDLGEKMNKTIAEGHITLRPNERVLLGTRLKFDIPQGYEVQIRDKSGISLKKGLKVFNAPGTIDSDYKKEVGIIMCNLTTNLIKINLGDRIAQGVIAPVIQASFVEGNVEANQRGGFGSTGTN